MKLRITVSGQAYDVEVEVLEGTSAGPPAPASTAPVARSADAHSRPPAPVPSAGRASPGASASGQPGEVQSPIAGSVVSVSVKVGDEVALNDTLLVLEAMKMESNVVSPVAGTVRDVQVSSGDAVQAGQVLVRIG